MDQAPIPSWSHTIRCVLWVSLLVLLVGAVLMLLPHQFFDGLSGIFLLTLRGGLVGLLPGLLLRNRRVMIGGFVACACADVCLRMSFDFLGLEWNARGAANRDLNRFLPPTHYGYRARPNHARYSFAEIVAIFHAMWVGMTACVSLLCVPEILRWWRRAIAAIITGTLVGLFFAYLSASIVFKIGFRVNEEGGPDWVATVVAIATIPAGQFAVWFWFSGRLGPVQFTGLCPRCSYDLRSIFGNTCPECGEKVSRLDDFASAPTTSSTKVDG